MPDVPRISGCLPAFDEAGVAKALKKSKKTESSVRGDPLPHLLRRHPWAFAKPVAALFNAISNCAVWPKKWKTEYMTIIPKVPNLADLSECRNISCTSALSKVLEGQLLWQLRSELIQDPTQFGGAPGCGAEHLLISIWDNIMECLETGTSAAVLLGVDFEKAFNKMDHAVCLEQLARLGASAGSISLVRAFLENREMTVIVGEHCPAPLKIRRGSPQGSVLGCLFYCTTTQTLTAKICRPREAADNDGTVVYFPQDDESDRDVIFWEVGHGGGEGPMAPGRDQLGKFKYIDDTTLVEHVELSKAVRHISARAPIEALEDLHLQDAFAELLVGAEAIGMSINKKKTQLLVVSPPNGYDTVASLKIEGEEDVASVDRLKLVGFTFGTSPNVAEHVADLQAKFRRSIWMIYHLREAGMRGNALYRMYCCYVRSKLEYCLPVFHSLLTAGQAATLERLHELAVGICFGFHREPAEIMTEMGIETLERRRIHRCSSQGARKPQVWPNLVCKASRG